MQLWAASEWNCRQLHGQCMVHCDCTALTWVVTLLGPYFSSHLLWGSACTQGQQSLIKHDPVYFKSWGANPVLKWVVTVTEQRRGAGQHPRQALATTTPITTPITGIMSSTSRKDVEGIHTKSNPHPQFKAVELIQATQGCSHIKPALQGHSG